MRFTVLIALIFLAACVGPTPEDSPYGTLHVDDSRNLHADVPLPASEVANSLSQCAGAESMGDGRFGFDSGPYRIVIETKELESNATRIRFFGEDHLGRAPQVGFLGPWSRAILNKIAP